MKNLFKKQSAKSVQNPSSLVFFMPHSVNQIISFHEYVKLLIVNNGTCNLAYVVACSNNNLFLSSYDCDYLIYMFNILIIC